VSKEETNPELDFERISVLYENTNVGYSGIAVGIAYIPRIIISVTFSRKMKALGKLFFLQQHYSFLVFFQRRIHSL
jgi:hypothetical protein